MEKVQIKTSIKLREWLVKNNHCPTVSEDADQETLSNVFGKAAARLLVAGELSTDKYEELMLGDSKMSRSPSAEKMFDRGSRIHVRDESEKYSDKRFVGRHIKSGQEIHNPFTGRATEIPSDRDNAKAGCLLKHLAKKSGLFSGVLLSENEKSLLDEMTMNDRWAGSVGGDYKEGISGSHVKTLIDDSTSGGTEITPIAFDDQVVTFPLLNGELFPRVDVRDIDRGRRIMGGSLANPTITWGTSEGTECDLFDTTALAAAVDHTVFNCSVAVEVGRDFMSDSGVNVGATLVANIGNRLQAELDKVIAVGNGTLQPEGIFTCAGGISTITTEGGAGAEQTMGDYAALMFGVQKQYRNRIHDPIFLSNDTTYARSRVIRTDPHVLANTVNQNPVLSDVNSFSNYQTMGWPHLIQNDIPNAKAAFVCLKKYRMFRRLGMSLRWVDGGVTLARENCVLLIVRARYAGRVIDVGGACKWTTGKA